MEQARMILTSELIVTMDANRRILRGGALLIENELIQDVGGLGEITKKYPSVEIIDFGDRLLMPGLVNAHTHVPMSLLRGLADDLRLDVWLLGYMMPVEREFVDPDFTRLGTSLACAEMIRGGVTCFADMYYYEQTVAEAASEAGLRGVCGQTVLKFPAPDADSFEDSLASAREFIEGWRGHPLITPAVAPHAPYTCTPAILEACAQLALEFDVPLHIHISETQQEVDEWREKYSMPVVPWIKKLGVLEPKVIAAHCVHIDEGEIHTLEHSRTGVAHNPSSNLKLASGFAPVTEMLETGLDVGIGTDGPASNNDLDMFEELRLASFIAKTVTKNPTALPAQTVVNMATRMGAQALHLGEITGSLESGKRADIISLDMSTSHNWPHYNREPGAIYSRIVYATKASDVIDVMVNGRWLMRDKQLLTLDETDLRHRAAEYARKIDAFLVEREGSVLSKLIAIGGAEQEESYEIQIKLKIPDSSVVLEKLAENTFEIVRTAHYREYDTYFSFPTPENSRLRYREDEFINDQGKVYNVRSRLTLTGPAAEREFENSVMLSRSRFIAPATHSVRFYREYFKPSRELEITKDRLRWLIRYEELEFFINLDHLLEPDREGFFLEIKSRTWSRHDAEHKAQLVTDILNRLGVEEAEPVLQEYPEVVASG
jgi:5-methylthioadenosine/S-adenosylhomocysteine deaminase